ncbi:MAG: SDR family NAD(P)-dependent oxidoreductase [Chthoniobacterales bacterium]
MKETIIIGATSAIGAALAKQLAAGNEKLLLVGRDEEKLKVLSADVEVRGEEKARVYLMDLESLSEEDLERFWQTVGAFKTLVLTAGVLSDENGSLNGWRRDIGVNFTATARIAKEAVDRLAQQTDGGVVMIVGSVAGDRGRQSNGFYGAQKAALERYAEALSHSAFLKNPKVKVALIKPGLVRSPMTANMKDSPLFSDPEAVARVMAGAIDKGQSGVFYAPWWWRGIMLIIKCVPNFIFKRTQL